MKKNWIRFSCFVLLFCIPFTILNGAMSYRWVGWSDFYNLPKNSVDIVFMGSSHNYVSFQPAIINDLLSVNSYVIGTPSENVIISYYELKELLKYQHPKVIVFETYTADVNVDLSTGFIYSFLDNVRGKENTLPIILRYLFPSKLDTLFPALRSRIEWEKPFILFNKVESYIKEQNHKDIDPNRGAQNFYSVITDTKYNDVKNYRDVESLNPIPDNKVFLEKLVTLCKEKDIQLIFTTTPILQRDPTHYDYSDPLDIVGYAEQNNIHRILFDYNKLFQIHYHDPTHVNPLGSIILSTEMAQSLSKELGLKVDQKALQGYQTFDFTGHSITKADNNYLIKINQADPNSPLLFQWKLLENGIELQKTDWQKSTTYNFTRGSTGEYMVEVRIKNPITGYTVMVSFPFVEKE